MLCFWGAPAGAASIVATPSSAAVGSTVTVSGDVLVNGQAGCQLPGQVTLISHAFDGNGEFAGVGAVFITADASGHYSAAVTIKAAVQPGTYTITGRCGGGNLGVEATLTISGLPRTGGSLGPLSDPEAAMLGGAFVLAGALALATTRRRHAVARAA